MTMREAELLVAKELEAVASSLRRKGPASNMLLNRECVRYAAMACHSILDKVRVSHASNAARGAGAVA